MSAVAPTAAQACTKAAEALTAGDGYEALSLYAHALAAHGWPAVAACEVPQTANDTGRAWVQRLLLLAAAASGDKAGSESLRELTLAPRESVAGPVCLVVGTTGPGIRLPDAEQLLDAAFATYRGTIICGGTGAGVAGIVGLLGTLYPQRLTTVGYAPSTSTHTDDRYHRLHLTDARDFSPWEALQTWTDLLSAGITPSEVRVLGLGGGRISAAEYRIALALDASVGILAELGRSGAQLLADELWADHPRLQRLTWEPGAVAEFVGAGQQ